MRLANSNMTCKAAKLRKTLPALRSSEYIGSAFKGLDGQLRRLSKGCTFGVQAELRSEQRPGVPRRRFPPRLNGQAAFLGSALAAKGVPTLEPWRLQSVQKAFLGSAAARRNRPRPQVPRRILCRSSVRSPRWDRAPPRALGSASGFGSGSGSGSVFGAGGDVSFRHRFTPLFFDESFELVERVRERFDLRALLAAQPRFRPRKASMHPSGLSGRSPVDTIPAISPGPSPSHGMVPLSEFKHHAGAYE